KNQRADIIEFRVDEFFDPSLVEADPDRRPREIVRLARESPLPCVVTCRSAAEGGAFRGTEAERLELYTKLAQSSDHPPRYLDIEYTSYGGDESTRREMDSIVAPGADEDDSRPKLIVSFHDFQGRPADLTRRLLAMRSARAPAVTKVAYRARSVRD